MHQLPLSATGAQGRGDLLKEKAKLAAVTKPWWNCFSPADILALVLPLKKKGDADGMGQAGEGVWTATPEVLR